MADLTYQPGVYRKRGGDELVISPSGTLTMEAGAAIKGANPWGAQDYYVDGNTTNTVGDGLSWATAFDTLAEAITASNTSIALTANRWWARRNRIFVCGDQEIVENLTILPEKCDVIGVGYDIYPFPRVVGNHTIAATRPTAAKAMGCRFINMGFIASGTGDLFVIPAGCHGFSMIGCHMVPLTTSTKALEITSCACVRLIDNIIGIGGGSMSLIFGVAISIEGTSYVHDIVIQGNHITATLGIDVVEATAAAMGGLIVGNIIRSTGYAIDDQSGDFQVVDNRWMTDINTTTSADGYDFNIQLAAGNIQNGATGLCDSVPFLKIAD